MGGDTEALRERWRESDRADGRERVETETLRERGGDACPCKRNGAAETDGGQGGEER